MEDESFVLVHDTQRKCYYLTLASALKNTEGLKVVEKFPNDARAMDALKKYASGQKVFGTLSPDKMKLTDAIGEEYGDEETYSSSAKGQKIDRPRAEQEMKKHNHQRGSPEWKEFEQIFGPRLFKPGGTIDAGELMNWLGY